MKQIQTMSALFSSPLSPSFLGRKISETYSSASFHSSIGCVRLSSHGQIVTYCQALPLVLLYREERQQYDELSRCSGFLPSSTYGAEHLLRLFGLSSTPSAHLSTLSLPSTPLHPLTSLHTSHFPPHLSTLSLPFAPIHLSVKLPQLFVNIETNQTDLRFLKQKLTEFLKYVSEFDLD
jgi:hypothetical protein